MDSKEQLKLLKKYLRLKTKPPKIETTKKTYTRKFKHKNKP